MLMRWARCLGFRGQRDRFAASYGPCLWQREARASAVGSRTQAHCSRPVPGSVHVERCSNTKDRMLTALAESPPHESFRKRSEADRWWFTPEIADQVDPPLTQVPQKGALILVWSCARHHPEDRHSQCCCSTRSCSVCFILQTDAMSWGLLGGWGGGDKGG